VIDSLKQSTPTRPAKISEDEDSYEPIDDEII